MGGKGGGAAQEEDKAAFQVQGHLNKWGKGGLNQGTLLTSPYLVTLDTNLRPGYKCENDKLTATACQALVQITCGTGSILHNHPCLPSLEPQTNTHFSSSMEAGIPVLRQDPCMSGQTGKYGPISTTCIALLQVTHGTGISLSNLTHLTPPKPQPHAQLG